MSDCRDRVLAEIDQDGFIFAADERDVSFFNTREAMVPRKHHRVQIVLKQGVVCIRKSAIGYGSTGIFAAIRDFLRWDSYLEAAALLRLRGVTGVPAIRGLQLSRGIIEMDYIWGRDLRQIFADGKCKIDYDDVSRRFAILIGRYDDEITQQIVEVLVNVTGRGVIPRDIHAANFIRGWRSGKLYLVDFNFIHLRPWPGWRAHVQNLASLTGMALSGAGLVSKKKNQRH